MRQLVLDLLLGSLILAVLACTQRSMDAERLRLAVVAGLALVAHAIRRPTWAHAAMLLLLGYEVIGYATNPPPRRFYRSLGMLALPWLGATFVCIPALSRSRPARVVFRVSWIVFVIVCGLIGTEWLVRRHEPKSFHELAPTGTDGASVFLRDARLGHRMRANWSGHFTHPEYARERFATNEHGFRDAPWTDESQNTLRVLMLGDSLVVGLGVEREEALPARLERTLTARLERPVRVRNVAVAGYGPAHHRILLEEHVPTWPADLVIACFYDGNDLQDASKLVFVLDERPVPIPDSVRATRFVLDDSPPLTLFSRTYWLSASALARTLEASLAPWFKRIGVPPPGWIFNHELVYAMAKTPDRVTFAQYARVERAFVAMAEHCRKHTVRFLLVRLPAKVQTERGSCAALLRHLGLDPADFDPTRPGSHVLATAREHGIETFDLLPRLQHPEESGSPYYFYEGHLDRPGIRAVVDALATHLLETTR